MYTREQAPWVEYLEINWRGKTKLSRKCPKDIKKKYREHLAEQKRIAKSGKFIPK